MKIVIKEKVIPYILISLFSFIGLQRTVTRQRDKAVAKRSFGRYPKLIRCTRMYNVTMGGILIYKTSNISKKCFGKKLSTEISEKYSLSVEENIPYTEC